MPTFDNITSLFTSFLTSFHVQKGIQGKLLYYMSNFQWVLRRVEEICLNHIRNINFENNSQDSAELEPPYSCDRLDFFQLASWDFVRNQFDTFTFLQIKYSPILILKIWKRLKKLSTKNDRFQGRLVFI